MIGHTNQISSESWEFLPWKKFQTNLFRLHSSSVESSSSRRYAESKVIAKANSPFPSSKILAAAFEWEASHSKRALAIRQVTQLNNGRKTAGVDGKLALTFKERFELEEELRLKANDWKHKGLREIPIPKKDGTKRILKVPTISDPSLAMQAQSTP